MYLESDFEPGSFVIPNTVAGTKAAGSETDNFSDSHDVASLLKVPSARLFRIELFSEKILKAPLETANTRVSVDGSS